MKKLLKKQGFTLVELIVVIAIIAIMLTMLIPSLSTGQSYEQEARENARAFYSNVQGLMIGEKLNGTKLNDDSHVKNSPCTLIYAHVVPSATSTLADTDVYVIYGNDITTVKAGTPADINDGDHPITSLQEFAGSLGKILSASEDEGHYYALVDDKYRVVYTYYSRDLDFDMMKSGTFQKDYIIKTSDGEEHYFGAYPFSMNLDTEKWRWKNIFPEPGDIAYHLPD